MFIFLNIIMGLLIGLIVLGAVVLLGLGIAFVIAIVATVIDECYEDNCDDDW